MLKISEIKVRVDENESILKDLIIKKLRIKPSALLDYKVYKKSIDARYDVVYKYQVLVNVENEEKYLKLKNVSLFKEDNIDVLKINSDIKPLVVGYGPAGIFATYRLVEAGLKPIVIEKGKRINERVKDVEKFFNEGILDPNSNVQFGEGGAGTFSDAKLTTRIKSPYVEYILDTFIKFGAKESIKYTPHAHIGTDEIRNIISNITDYLIDKGADFHFIEEIEELLIDENRNIIGVKTNKDTYKSPICILAIGHSAYKTIKMLDEKNVYIEAKDIAVGFRVEHPQSLIDKNQLGEVNLKEPSEYFLRYKDEKGVYSFCMCPGGMVIPASSDLNRIVTNGMSYSKRDSGIANSAILIQVNKEEYPSGKLGGFLYLKQLEEKAYKLSNSYKAPCCNIRDFINDENNELIFKSTYPLGTYHYNLNKLFNDKDTEIFKKALLFFDNKIKGFVDKGIMLGPETRSSCPIRIKRDENLESINTKGLYPSGEGAGYGGGIMSCSIDGLKVADKVLINLRNSSL